MKTYSVDYFGGATFVTDEFGGYGGMSLGNYINTNIRDEIIGSFQSRVISDPLYMHEYGHTFDSQFWGPLYLFVVGIPSWLSANKSEQIVVNGLKIHEHDFKSFERRANKYASQYFGQYYNISWHKYEPPRNSFPLRKRKYYNP